ncbi:MAG TPA: glycosyltransferase family 4 protein [Armatimonadota bacterium]|nr:glycosyltransferase family 4 protein [Armatimonadota bacterium]
MKVVIIGNYPADKSRILGGTAAVAWRLADALSKLPEMEVHTISLAKGLRSRRDEKCNLVHEHYLPSGPATVRTLYYFPDRLHVARVLREIQPDIVHVHGQLRYPACVWTSGFPWIMTPHGLVAREASLYSGPARWVGWFYVRQERQAYRMAKNIILCSDYIRPFVEPHTKAQLYKAANALDDRYFQIPDKEVQGSILFAGSMTRRKGVMHLFQAMKVLKERGVKCKLFLVGKTNDSEYGTALRKYLEENPLSEYVDWLGTVEEQRLRELYGECSLLVLPSLEESLPTVIAQAMAAGKPVVGADSAGIPFMVHDGETGYLAEYGNPTDLADKIQRLIEDPALRQSMGKAARKEAEALYSSEGVAGTHLEIYRRAIDHWNDDL